MVPKNHRCYILGPGGTKLQELEQKNANKISFSKTFEKSDKIAISISGPKKGVVSAIQKILIISDEHSKQSYEVLSIPKYYHLFIIGPKNDYINKMLAENPSVGIKVPPLSLVYKGTISLTGESKEVQDIKTRIMDNYKGMMGKYSTIRVEDIRKSNHIYVRGPKGCHFNEILSDILFLLT